VGERSSMQLLSPATTPDRRACIKVMIRETRRGSARPGKACIIAKPGKQTLCIREQVRHAPVISLGQVRHAPVISLGQVRHPPVISLGEVRHPPVISLGQVRHAPVISLGQVRHAPVISLGQVRHPPVISLGQVRHAPVISLGEIRHAPVISLGEVRHAPVISQYRPGKRNRSVIISYCQLPCTKSCSCPGQGWHRRN